MSGCLQLVSNLSPETHRRHDGLSPTVSSPYGEETRRQQERHHGNPLSWAVGSRVCTLNLPRKEGRKSRGAWLSWAPSPPAALSAQEWKQFRDGHEAALRWLSKQARGP